MNLKELADWVSEVATAADDGRLFLSTMPRGGLLFTVEWHCRGEVSCISYAIDRLELEDSLTLRKTLEHLLLTVREARKCENDIQTTTLRER